MRTVITISLNGNAYQLDAVGYDALRAYLQVAEQRLAGNPDQAEILADLEQAIADKCNRYLGPHKNVISADEVAEVIREMGPVDGGAGEAAAHGGGSGAGMGSGGIGTGSGATAGTDANTGAGMGSGVGAGIEGGAALGGGVGAGVGAGAGMGAGVGIGAGRTYTAGEYAEAVGENWTAEGGGVGGAGASSDTGSAGSRAGYAGATTSPGAAAAPGETPRRLYQIREGSVFSGVCKGLAAYLNIDVSVIRILFIVLAVVTGGVWVLVYIVMMFVVPFAETSEQHAAAHGWPFNAEELISRAKTHYAAFKESEKWRRKQWREERRMWNDQRKQWKQERKAWERAGGTYGAPPPPPPPWSGAAPPGANPANLSYSSQVVHGALTPLVELVGALLFIAFLLALFSIVTKHRVFGWGLPGDVPGWVGVLVLIVLYRTIVSPLRRARYAGYYGPHVGQGWLALLGVLLWLAIVTFCVWMAWQHWSEVQAFFQQLVSSIRDFIDDRPAPADHMQAALLPVLPGGPMCLLSWRARAGELQSHG
jgi:phage shock protein PspC (stress-responsive transcriptional regulator)